MLSRLFVILTLISPALAQEPKSTPKVYPGEAMVEKYYRSQVKQIADHCLTNLTTREDWEKQRPELKRQFLEMVGLWPLPQRTDLKATITGTVEGEGFVVEKLHFQSMPGLYVTGNFYKPKNADAKKPIPTTLYVCGHGNVVENNVSFGSKVHYQYHPAWFATHGYNCLILDTLQLSEIPGVHHGTYRMGMWWWQCYGYTPAGIELWNAMRALDYLETRPEVDAKKIGVTGRSGGGATSWWLVAGDDRPACYVPVAGIVDLQNHLCEGKSERLKKGVITGHCDCMFMVNKYRWDFPMVAALAAPRPVLLGNSDVDDIFPVEGYRRLADKVRKVYALYGKDTEEKFQLLETEGPHKDTPELRFGINKWMNRWLKDDVKTKVEDDLPPKLAPQQLKVLEKTPADSINANLHDHILKPITIELPATNDAKAWWPKKQAEILEKLKTECFAGWPAKKDVTVTRVSEFTLGDLTTTTYDVSTEAEITLRMSVVTHKDTNPEVVKLAIVDDEMWRQSGSGGDAKKEFAKLTEDQVKFATRLANDTAEGLKKNKSALVYFAPRGYGESKFAEPFSAFDVQHRRRYALLGQTLDGQRVWDTRCAVSAVSSIFSRPKPNVHLIGMKDLAGVALYASLFEKDVSDLALIEPTTTHKVGPTFLNVLRIVDMPQAVALAASRGKSVNLLVTEADRKAWDWPESLQKLTGEKSLSITVKGK